MKKLILIAALGLSSATAFAQTVGQAFNVTASLTSQCVSNNAAPSDVAFGTYTAFGSAATPAPTTAISFRCTKNFAATPSASLDSGTGSIAGVAYTLTAGAGVKTTTSGAAGTVGTYDVYTYTITGGMASGQAGDASIAAAAQVHTLTISY